MQAGYASTMLSSGNDVQAGFASTMWLSSGNDVQAGFASTMWLNSGNDVQAGFASTMWLSSGNAGMCRQVLHQPCGLAVAMQACAGRFCINHA